MTSATVLLHLASGVGNLVLATPLLRALADLDFAVDLRLDPDYPDAAGLFQDWSVIRTLAVGRFPAAPIRYDHVAAAVPPFYWNRFAHLYRNVPHMLRRPPDFLFTQDEQAYYLAFARRL